MFDKLGLVQPGRFQVGTRWSSSVENSVEYVDWAAAFFRVNKDEIQTASAIVQAVVLAIGALGGLYAYAKNARREQRHRDRQVFQEIDDIYFRINELIVRHPQLDVSWYSNGINAPLTADQKLQQDTMFELITRMFERAFLAYLDASANARRQEWQGWKDFIGDYSRKTSYRDWWNKEDWPLRRIEQGGYSQYNAGFEKFMNEMMRTGGKA
jgi:hypothetical protein